jgi:DNA-directed RNA polymerase specialized sigma24 family protein
VREEEEEARVVFSRELAFVPGSRRPSFDTSNAETRALIRRYDELTALPNGERVMERLEEWKWPWGGRSAADKQRFLEPLIAAVQREPVANEDMLLFLLIVFEPVRRSVGGAFRRARSGLAPPDRDVDWSNRAEAKMLRHVERERLEDVTREAVLRSIARYPTEPPRSLFGWLRENIAHRALDELSRELPQITGGSLDAPEARAIGVFLDLIPNLEAPLEDENERRHRRVLVTDPRRLYGVVDQFFEHEPVRHACREAIGRLPTKQGEVIEALYLREIDAASVAGARGISVSTVYNHSAQAKANLYADDSFFRRLHALGVVRDRARAQDIERRCPGGRMADGRRRVVIEEAA